jgi:hypothetical protein
MWGWLAVVITASATAFAQPEPAPEPEAPPESQPAPSGPTLDIDPEWWLRKIEAIDFDGLVDRIAAIAPGLESVARGTIRRGRRAISIGPTAGVYGAGIPSPGETDLGVTFGLGLELFKIPVMPTFQNLKALVIERAKANLKKAAIDTFRGREPQPIELEQLARQAWDEAVKEILGLQSVRAKRIEKPRLTLAVEGNYLLRSETWMTRLRAGAGFWKVTLAATVTAGFTDPDTSVFVGPEVVLHVLMSKGPRASVVDVYLRGDFEVRNRDIANTDMVTVGVRYLLDLI